MTLMDSAEVMETIAPAAVAPFQLRPMASTGKVAAAKVAQPIAPSNATSVLLASAMPAASTSEDNGHNSRFGQLVFDLFCAERFRNVMNHGGGANV